MPGWACPTCRKTVTTPFCSQCGERPVQPRDLTLPGLTKKFFNALTSIDSKLMRTLALLLRRPGELTVAYLDGRRKPYLAPLQLFLLANVLFFAIQSFTSINIFGASIESHLHQQDWSAVAGPLVEQRLKETRSTLAAYAPVFDKAVVLNAKSLIVLMAVAFALLLPLAFFRSRRPLATHVIFSLHLYTFLLLVFCLSLVVAMLDVWFGGAGLNSAWMDNVLSVFNLAACAVYLYVATHTVYGAVGFARGVTVVLLAISVAAIVLGYRFVLFLITLYAT
ncbi:MAG: DUF3667 domain-containing protein [Burkholderiaceae bacterium]|nr:DUF3667 domain-containing protein [Burkholderiaceae bacterium]